MHRVYWKPLRGSNSCNLSGTADVFTPVSKHRLWGGSLFQIESRHLTQEDGYVF